MPVSSSIEIIAVSRRDMKSSITGLEELGDLLLAQDRRLWVQYNRRPHPRHRVWLDLLLDLIGPLEELLQGPVVH
jgi:hypothetical protein